MQAHSFPLVNAVALWLPQQTLFLCSLLIGTFAPLPPWIALRLGLGCKDWNQTRANIWGKWVTMTYWTLSCRHTLLRWHAIGCLIHLGRIHQHFSYKIWYDNPHITGCGCFNRRKAYWNHFQPYRPRANSHQIRHWRIQTSNLHQLHQPPSQRLWEHLWEHLWWETCHFSDSLAISLRVLFEIDADSQTIHPIGHSVA